MVTMENDPQTLPAFLVDGPLLRGVPREARLDFLDAMHLQTYPPGDVLFFEGEMGDEFVLVVSGEVVIINHTEVDEPVELTRVRPGDFFGEMALLSPAPRSASAIALSYTTALSMPRLTYLDRLERGDPASVALLRSIARRVCQRLRATDARIDLVHDALHCADVAELEARLVNLTGRDQSGPSGWRESLLQFFGGM
jgi:CRP-like cAMP-binding protein